MSLPFPALRRNCSAWAASMCSLRARTRTRRKSSTHSTAQKVWCARTAGKDCREVITDRVARLPQRSRRRSPTASSCPRRCARPRNTRGKRSTRGSVRVWVNTYQTGFFGRGKWMSRAQARPEHWVVSHAGVRGLYAVTPDEPDIGVLTRKVGTALLALCREARIPFVINDDLDLARAIRADGLHLGRDDVSIAAARAKLGEDKLLGVSCYDRLELALDAREAGADYVAFGSAFPSSTKPEVTRAPLSLYREARARLDFPIVAIGGITTENAHAVIEAGADAVADRK